MLTMVLIINSCRKDTKLIGQQTNSVETASHLAVSDAKAWFGNNKTTLATKIKLTSETSFLSKIANFTPLWDSARTAVDTNFYVVEVPAKYVKKIAFTTDGTQNNVNGITRLLVLKDKRNGDLSAALMQVHGEPGSNITNVHYMSVPQNFSGNIFYTTLQGLFVNGNIYENGKITRTSKRTVTQATKPGGPQVFLLPAPGDCETILIGYFEQTCVTYSDVEFCSDEVLIYTEEYTYCTPATGGGGGGGYTPPTCPPGTPGTPPTNPPILVESINGKKMIRLVQGGDPGAGCPVEPPPVEEPPKIDNQVKDPCLHKMVEASRSVNIQYSLNETMNSVFDQNTNFNIDFTDALPQTFSSPNVDGDAAVDNIKSHLIKQPDGTNRKIIDFMNVSIRLNSSLSNSSKEYVTATIIHEALHAYLSYSQTIVNQHLDMARNYLNSMSTQLQSMYPNLSASDANALAWGGLQSEAGSLYNSLSTVEKNNISNINSAYKSGTSGQPCTP